LNVRYLDFLVEHISETNVSLSLSLLLFFFYA